MNRRENFSAVVNHQQPEWVPVDLGRHVGSIHRLSYIKLRDYLNDPSLQNENKILDRMVQNVIPDEKLLRFRGKTGYRATPLPSLWRKRAQGDRPRAKTGKGHHSLSAGDGVPRLRRPGQLD